MSRIDLSALMGEMILKPGTWFWLLDADTKFAQKERHPWVFPTGFDPAGRTALAHALPRSSRKPFPSDRAGVDFLHHSAHGSCDGMQCALNKEGWIVAQRSQVPKVWINRGRYICEEPSLQVLGQIQNFEMNACR